MKMTPSKIMARKKPTSMAIKSYFEDLGASLLFDSVVDVAPPAGAVTAGVADGVMLEGAGA
jgi:hypothetical protein